MPYSKNDYPTSMKNLPTDTRNKAIEIANELEQNKGMKAGIAIPTAISRAKDWAENRGKKSGSSGSDSDKKNHGADYYVLPHKNGWAVKKEKNKEVSQVFDTKDEAIDEAKRKAKENNSNLIIQDKDGKIQTKRSYNN